MYKNCLVFYIYIYRYKVPECAIRCISCVRACAEEKGAGVSVYVHRGKGVCVDYLIVGKYFAKVSNECIGSLTSTL